MATEDVLAFLFVGQASFRQSFHPGGSSSYKDVCSSPLVD